MIVRWLRSTGRVSYGGFQCPAEKCAKVPKMPPPRFKPSTRGSVTTSSKTRTSASRICAAKATFTSAICRRDRHRLRFAPSTTDRRELLPGARLRDDHAGHARWPDILEHSLSEQHRARAGPHDLGDGRPRTCAISKIVAPSFTRRSM